jgi:hypothetical protein
MQMNWRHPVSIFRVVCILSFLCQAEIALAQVQQFALQNVRMQPDERVESIELFVKAGSFIGFDPLPMGWYLIIDNDPSQQTSIKGDARVGTGALTPNGLMELRIRIRKVEFGDQIFSISGTLIVIKDFESERKIPLTADNFKVISSSAK